MSNWLTDFFKDDPTPRPTSRHINTGRLDPRDIDKSVAARTDIDDQEVRRIRANLFRVIAEGIDQGKRVSIRGFGTFSISRRSARTMKLPSGLSVDVPERDIPRWTPSQVFKDWMERPGPEG